MKKIELLLVAAMVLVLTGCGHEHTWKDADCTNPKTCTECGETEGAALGHAWKDATCKAPKTCSVCKETEGSALEHTWVAADCTTAKTCSECGTTEGSALGHTWLEATYEAPQTCSMCGETEGDPLPAPEPEPTAEAATLEEYFCVLYPEMYETSQEEIKAVQEASAGVYTNIEFKLDGNDLYYIYTLDESVGAMFTEEIFLSMEESIRSEGVFLIDALEDSCGIRANKLYFAFDYYDGTNAYTYVING